MARTKSYQKQFIDPQAPIGTEAKSSKKASAKAELDKPVETKAVDPDSASDLQRASAVPRWPMVET